MSLKNSGINIFKFRVIVDTEQDVFRDIEIATGASFESLNQAILDAFDFESGEMASFYMSNENWEKGLEIPLLEMDSGKQLSMKTTTLESMLGKPGDKVLYVYDFMRMWIFYVELLEVKKEKPATIYPRVALAYGDAPSQDSKEMDFMGNEFNEDEFNEVYGNSADDVDFGSAGDEDDYGFSEYEGSHHDDY